MSCDEHEEQNSIWSAERAYSLGWRDAGASGIKAECLAHIEAVRIDMRPLSLRRAHKQPSGEE